MAAGGVLHLLERLRPAVAEGEVGVGVVVEEPEALLLGQASELQQLGGLDHGARRVRGAVDHDGPGLRADLAGHGARRDAVAVLDVRRHEDGSATHDARRLGEGRPGRDRDHDSLPRSRIAM
jgi:hypothetical protein